MAATSCYDDRDRAVLPLWFCLVPSCTFTTRLGILTPGPLNETMSVYMCSVDGDGSLGEYDEIVTLSLTCRMKGCIFGRQGTTQIRIPRAGTFLRLV